jgi:hypothetical protein
VLTFRRYHDFIVLRSLEAFQAKKRRKDVKAQVGKVAVAVMVALFMGGCTNTTIAQSEMPEKPYFTIPSAFPDIARIKMSKKPYLTATSPRSPREVAKCIEMRSRTELGGFLAPHPDVFLEELTDQTYSVFLSGAYYSKHSGWVSVLVKPSGSGSVVEYRGAGVSSVLEIMSQCAFK